VLEVIVRRANLQTTGTIYNNLHPAVWDAYLALEREAAKVGLDINEQKTKYMIAARNDRTIRDVGKSLAIGD
jgi:hypothetical protein